MTELEATYPEIKKRYDDGIPELVKLQAQARNLLEVSNKSVFWKEKVSELREAKLRCETPLRNYQVLKYDLFLELEHLTGPFISEKRDQWQKMMAEVESQEVYQEIPPPKNLPGEYSVGMNPKIFSNRKGIYLFKLKSLEILNHLRDMTHSTFEEIERFLEESEKIMKGIDLTPVTIVMDGRTFRDDSRDLVQEPGTQEIGFLGADNNITAISARSPTDEGLSREDKLELDHFHLQQKNGPTFPVDSKKR